MSLVLLEKVLPVVLLLEKIHAFCEVQESVPFSNRKKKNPGTINFHDSFILRTLTTKSVRRGRNVNPTSTDTETEGSGVFLACSGTWEFPLLSVDILSFRYKRPFCEILPSATKHQELSCLQEEWDSVFIASHRTKSVIPMKWTGLLLWKPPKWLWEPHSKQHKPMPHLTKELQLLNDPFNCYPLIQWCKTSLCEFISWLWWSREFNHTINTLLGLSVANDAIANSIAFTQPRRDSFCFLVKYQHSQFFREREAVLLVRKSCQNHLRAQGKRESESLKITSSSMSFEKH